MRRWGRTSFVRKRRSAMKRRPWQLQLTAETFEKEVLDDPGPVLVHFHAEWCGPCHIVRRAIDELETGFGHRVKACELDVDRSPRTAEEYGVGPLPTVLVFRGGAPIRRLTGPIPRSELVTTLVEALSD